MSAYADEWKDLVKRGIKSYIEVTKDLQEQRRYHKSRSWGRHGDSGGGFPDFWVPLFWGTF